MARKFFYVCAGMFLLALSYHLGASAAGAQAMGNNAVALAPEGGNTGWTLVLSSNGDVYRSQQSAPTRSYSFERVGNVFSGGPIPALQQSWGQVKARYRSTPGMTVTPGADNR